MLAAVRAHWSVENGLRWVLDEGEGEDGHRAWRDRAPENLGMLRQLALNLLKRTEGPKKGMSLKVKRKRAAWDDAFLEQVLAQL